MQCSIQAASCRFNVLFFLNSHLACFLDKGGWAWSRKSTLICLTGPSHHLSICTTSCFSAMDELGHSACCVQLQIVYSACLPLQTLLAACTCSHLNGGICERVVDLLMMRDRLVLPCRLRHTGGCKLQRVAAGRILLLQQIAIGCTTWQRYS